MKKIQYPVIAIVITVTNHLTKPKISTKAISTKKMKKIMIQIASKFLTKITKVQKFLIIIKSRIIII